MAGQKIAEVRLGAPKVGGYGFSAPIGSTRPTAAGTTLDAAYIDLGFISEEGVEVTTENGTTKIKDWNLDTIAVVQESNECTIGVTFVQVSPALAKELFGTANVVITGTAPADKVTKIGYTGEILPHKMYAFPMKDGNGDMLIDIGDGQVTSVSGLKFVKNQVVSFTVTIECFKDAAGKFFNWHLV
ncbi:hypothetical protein ACSDQ9_05770 [Aestuariimicrobium soli]|uniref:phage tail tube protein n=1 Tax=Aestuariimicrobium soli TaxID=2035834 RepID=UPI003EBEADD6